MSLSLTVLNQVLVMFILMLVGALCFKTKLVNEQGKHQLTSLLLYVVNPMVIVSAYDMPFDEKLANKLLLAFGLAIISHLLGMAISYLFIRKKYNEERAPIERFSIIYTNCGFMAFPLINALYGSEGLFYASAYITIFNLLSWTHGFIMISGKADKKAILKSFVSPVIIAVIFGIAIFFLRIELPSILSNSISYLATLNTPIAMIVTGISLAQINIFSVFKSLRCYYVVFLMNIVVPLFAIAIYLFLPIDQNLIIVNLIATACPCAVTTLLFSTKFNRDPEYATKLLTLANISCIITIPSVIFLYQFLSQLMK